MCGGGRGGRGGRLGGKCVWGGVGGVGWGVSVCGGGVGGGRLGGKCVWG